MRVPSRFIFSFVFSCLVAGCCLAQNDSLKKQAYEYARKGMELVDKKHLDEAIESFEKGFALDPQNSNFQYEIAVVHYLRKEYARTISILEKYKNKPDANDQYYQILGNAYDLSRQAPKARKIYAEGIKRFPSSGVLYLEAGILEYMQGKNPEALRYWESGVIAQPEFPMNYYWLAKTYAPTTEKVWAVLYGEMFINIDRNSEKTQEVSKLLYDIYKQCLPSAAGGKAEAEFTRSILLNPVSGVSKPFGQEFSETMNRAADSLFREGADSIGQAELCRIRDIFLFYWQSRDLLALYPCILIDRFKKLKELDYFESYNRWIFLKGNEDTFQSWYYSNTDKYTSFVNWFRKNPIKVNKQGYFSRSLY